MTLRLVLVLAALCLALSPGLATAQTYDKNVGVTTFADGHPPEMLRAIEKAQATLPAVLDLVRAGRNTFSHDLSFKVSIKVAEGYENIWVDQIRRTSTGFSGKLANEPVHLVGKRFGSKVSFDQAQIIDWSITSRDGRLFGHLTTRVILETLPAREAQSARDLLTRNPFPKGVN